MTKLVKNETYKSQVNQNLNINENEDSLNLFDDKPELIFGPDVNGKPQKGGVRPFYISFNIHDKILHNAMLDSRASHNLMPKLVMEKLNLDITRPYKDLFSFDSSQVKCLGLIKDLCITLVQYPAKRILMDIVVVDIPPKYGMLLSRSWGAKLQGSLQLDMSYATISVFGQPKKMYRETFMKYMVSSQNRPQNYPIYSMHSDVDSFIMFNTDQTPNETPNSAIAEPKEITVFTANESKETSELCNEESSEVARNKNKWDTDDENYVHEILWHLEFDGSVNKLGVGAGVWIYNLE